MIGTLLGDERFKLECVHGMTTTADTITILVGDLSLFEVPLPNVDECGCVSHRHALQ